MKRLHVNLGVKSVEASVSFYTALFNAEPTVQKPDYAKWSLTDPSVNFSISLAPDKPGVKHLGIEAGTEDELKEIYGHIGNAENVNVREEGHTVCCYHQSEKSWIKDPQDVEWEAFYTYGTSEVNKEASENACCDDNCCETEPKEEAVEVV